MSKRPARISKKPAHYCQIRPIRILGLALIHMNDSELEKAEDELHEAQRNGFRPGRREQKALADGL